MARHATGARRPPAHRHQRPTAPEPVRAQAARPLSTGVGAASACGAAASPKHDAAARKHGTSSSHGLRRTARRDGAYRCVPPITIVGPLGSRRAAPRGNRTVRIRMGKTGRGHDPSRLGGHGADMACGGQATRGTAPDHGRSPRHDAEDHGRLHRLGRRERASPLHLSAKAEGTRGATHARSTAAPATTALRTDSGSDTGAQVALKVAPRKTRACPQTMWSKDGR